MRRRRAGMLRRRGGNWRHVHTVLAGGCSAFLTPAMPPLPQLEGAKIETELPPGLVSAAPYKGAGHFITITVHSSFAFSCEHPFWVLAAPSQEVQMAWVNACWQVGDEGRAGHRWAACVMPKPALPRTASQPAPCSCPPSRPPACPGRLPSHVRT